MIDGEQFDFNKKAPHSRGQSDIGAFSLKGRGLDATEEGHI
jgi:hypothetical protein